MIWWCLQTWVRQVSHSSLLFNIFYHNLISNMQKGGNKYGEWRNKIVTVSNLWKGLQNFTVTWKKKSWLAQNLVMFQSHASLYQLQSKLKLPIFSVYIAIPFSYVGSCRPFVTIVTLSAGRLGWWNLFSVARPELLTIGVQISNWMYESIHWVTLSVDDVIEQVSRGGCF